MFITISLIILAVMSVISVIRIIIGPTVWDRLMCFNLLTSKASIIFVLYATMSGMTYLLDFAITFVLLGFISGVFIANFVQKREEI